MSAPAGEPEVAPDASGLSVVGVCRRFAGIRALDDVGFDVAPGDRLGLVGPNGAGKTTLLDCISGVQVPDGGRIVLGGHDVTRTPAHRRARMGIGRTFQRVGLFSGLTVREHLVVAQRAHRGVHALAGDLVGHGRVSSAEIERSDEILGRLGIAALATAPVETLTFGRARLVEVARALAADPTLLLLDEPSSGLDRRETDDLAATLQAVQDDRDVAIVLVDHDLELVAGFTQRCVVLDFGRVIASGPTATVLADPAVRAAYLGVQEEAAP
jgi:branched-chain amino acid transport system ATP-binding protein